MPRDLLYVHTPGETGVEIIGHIYTYERVSNGDDADTKLCTCRAFRVAVIDINVEYTGSDRHDANFGLGGLKLIERIRRGVYGDGQRPDMPIIAITAETPDPALAGRLRELQVWRVLQKPVGADTLLDYVEGMFLARHQ